jgi:steroid delta-isomerase-like uncharacterized protein
VDGLLDLYAEDAFFRSPRGLFKSKEAIRQAFAGIYRVMPDLHTGIDRLFGTGRYVALECTVRATLVQPHPDVAGSRAGGTFENVAVHLFEFRDGKIIGDVAYFDTAAVARQLTAH